MSFNCKLSIVNYKRGRHLKMSQSNSRQRFVHFLKVLPKAPLNAFKVFPVQTEIPKGAQTAYQRIYDSYGMTEIISNYADDLRRVDVIGEEKAVKVVDIGDSYGYSINEIKIAVVKIFEKKILLGTQKVFLLTFRYAESRIIKIYKNCERWRCN